MRFKAGRVVREADPYGSATRSAVGRDDVGIVPYGYITRGAGEESPSHGCAVPAPFRQGGFGRGMRIATGAVRPRNDRVFARGAVEYPAGGQRRPPLRKCRNTCVGRRALTPP